MDQSNMMHREAKEIKPEFFLGGNTNFMSPSDSKRQLFGVRNKR